MATPLIFLALYVALGLALTIYSCRTAEPL